MSTVVAAAFVTVLLALGFSSNVARAATNHCGEILSDETWSPQGNPHHITCEVIVKPGVNLTIAAGSHVYFDGYYSIFIEGTLRVATDAANDQVLFTTNDQRNPARGDWRSIQFNESASNESYIASAVIEWADYGIYLDHASPLSFNWTLIRDNTYGLYSDHGTPWLANTTIEDSTYEGIHTIGLDPDGRGFPHTPPPPVAINWPPPIYIEYSTVRDNGEYGGIFEESALNISDSSFTGNGLSGIYWSNPNGTVRWSNISSNGLGGSAEDSAGIALVPGNSPVGLLPHDPDINNNTVSDNYIGVYVGIGDPDIVWNEIADSDEYGIWIENGATAYVMNNTIQGSADGIGSWGSISEVFNNTIQGFIGIQAFDESQMLVVGNSIDAGEIGIESCESNMTILRNTIEGYDLIGIWHGINGACPEDWWVFDVENNTVDGTDTGAVGIYVQDGGTYTIRNNSIVRHVNVGIAILDPDAQGKTENNSLEWNYVGAELYGDIIMRYNNIMNSDLYGVMRYTYGGSNAVDARWNWWGDRMGPDDPSFYGVCPFQDYSGDVAYDTASSLVNWCGAGSDYLRMAAETGPYQ